MKRTLDRSLSLSLSLSAPPIQPYTHTPPSLTPLHPLHPHTPSVCDALTWSGARACSLALALSLSLSLSRSLALALVSVPFVLSQSLSRCINAPFRIFSVCEPCLARDRHTDVTAPLVHGPPTPFPFFIWVGGWVFRSHPSWAGGQPRRRGCESFTASPRPQSSFPSVCTCCHASSPPRRVAARLSAISHRGVRRARPSHLPSHFPPRPGVVVAGALHVL